MASFCYGSSRLSGERGFLSCRVLSSLCRPLLSGLPPASSNSLCSVIPPQHPESRLGSLCRQQAGEAAQLISQVSQLPEITADPPA